MLALPWLVAKIVLLLAGLLLPGAALMRALRVPATIATSFGGSATLLFLAIVGLQLASIPIALGSIAAILAAVTIVALVASRRNSARDALPAAPATASSTPVPTWCAPLFFAFGAVVVWRAFHDPLAGPDVGFRWSFLAEQMLRLGNLDFYPPRSADDFLSYFWPESIPPGVSALHAWAFACAGASKPLWTAPAVVLQLWTLHELLWRIAGQAAGRTAAVFACAAAIACPLLTWSALLGQETGLTAIALLGIVWSLQCWQASRDTRWAAAAGIFALLGAATREYGLIFPGLAGAGLLVLRADRRAWLAFASCAAPAFLWPLRTFVLTGNPFYSLSFAGLPTNATFVAAIAHDSDGLAAPLRTGDGWMDVARYLTLFALPALAGWGLLVAGVFRRNRAAALLAVGSAALLALWIASVPYTNGGLFYSMRVTAPALALGSLATGVALARLASGRAKRVVPWIVGGAIAASLPATLALPRNPWRTPVHEWPAFAARGDDAGEIVALMRRLGAPPLSLADSPAFKTWLGPAGMNVVPLWSPQADWLFDPNLAAGEAAQRWRESGARHLIVTKWQTNLDFLNRHSRWGRPPFHVQWLGQTSSAVVFSIHARPE